MVQVFGVILFKIAVVLAVGFAAFMFFFGSAFGYPIGLMTWAVFLFSGGILIIGGALKWIFS